GATDGVEGMVAGADGGLGLRRETSTCEPLRRNSSLRCPKPIPDPRYGVSSLHRVWLARRGMRGMKKLIVAIVLATCIGILALPATAGGRKGNTAGGISTIKLESYSDLRLGGYAGFETNAVGLAGWEYPMVAVWCYQSGDLV